MPAGTETPNSSTMSARLTPPFPEEAEFNELEPSLDPPSKSRCVGSHTEYLVGPEWVVFYDPSFLYSRLSFMSSVGIDCTPWRDVIVTVVFETTI